MENEQLESCVNELRKPPEERDIQKIQVYLETLPSFMQLIKQDLNKYNSLLGNLALIMKLKECPKDELIIRNGEKGNDFYIILKGKVSILTLKNIQHKLSEEEYIFHLLKLRINNEFDLLKQTIMLNNLIYPVNEDNFDVFMRNISLQKSKGGLYQDNIEIVDKIIETIQLLRKNDEYKTRKNFTTQEYIDKDKISQYQVLRFQSADKKKEVVIPEYEVINTLETGRTLGDIALESSSGKRTASVITAEQCFFATFDKLDYEKLIKSVIEKNKRKFFNVIYSYSLFTSISRYVFDKRYYNVFKYEKCERNQVLVTEGEKLDSLYFVLSGEYELYTYKSVIEVNQLILKYKRKIRELEAKTEEDLEAINYIVDDEKKENDDLILNKKFKSPETNAVIFEKRMIKVGICHEREVIGLCDLRDEKTGVGILGCRSLSYTGEVYMTRQEVLRKMCENEEGVIEATKKFQVKRMNMLIERLKLHKQTMYELIKKNDIESVREHQNKNKSSLRLLGKNRFNKAEDNSVLVSNGIKIMSNPKSLKTLSNSPKKSHFTRYKYSVTTENDDSSTIINNNNNSTFGIRKRSPGYKKAVNKKKLNNLGDQESALKIYHKEIVKRHLYDNMIYSYMNSKEEKVANVYDNCRTDSNINFVDCLIMDKFNKKYSTVVKDINKSKYSNTPKNISKKKLKKI